MEGDCGAVDCDPSDGDFDGTLFRLAEHAPRAAVQIHQAQLGSGRAQLGSEEEMSWHCLLHGHQIIRYDRELAWDAFTT